MADDPKPRRPQQPAAKPKPAARSAQDDDVAGKAYEMRRQGFFGAAMLPMTELEYTGITRKLSELDARFVVRK